MATSAKKEITCGYNGHYHLYMTITAVKQEIANNRTLTNVSMYAKSDSSSYGAYNLSTSANTSKMTVDGTQVVNKTMAMDFRNMATVNLAEWEGWINHDAQGKKKITCSGSFTISGSSYLSGGEISCDISLDDIPRATKPTLSVTTVELGKILTIGIAPAVSTWKHKLYYKFGSGSWTNFHSGDTGNYNWTVPLDIASNLKDVTSGTMTIGLNTYSDAGMTKQIGVTQTINVKVTVPATVKPTISSVTVSDAESGLSAYGFVQGKSRLRLVTDADGIYGSTIKSIKHKIGSTTYTAGDDWTSGVINASGDLSIATTVTDSRGRTEIKNTTITVLPYKVPQITKFVCERCNSDGTLNNNGTYVKITSNFSVSPLNNKNGNRYVIDYKSRQGNTWVTITSGNTYAYNQSYITGGNFSATDSYDIRLTVTDSFTNGVAVSGADASSRLISYIIKKMALAIGKVAEIANTFEVALDSIFRNLVTFCMDCIFRGSAKIEQGTWVHHAKAGGGTEGGYLRIAHIVYGATLRDVPITFVIISRASKIPTVVSIKTKSATELDSFCYTGGTLNMYVHKVTADAFDIYIKRENNFGWEEYGVVDCWFDKGKQPDVNIQWLDEHVASLPSGYVQATEFGDSGWLNPTFAVSAGDPAAGKKVQYRVINGVMYIHGSVKAIGKVAGQSLALFSVPYKPSGNIYFTNTATGARISRFMYTTSGNIYLEWCRELSNGVEVTGDITWVGIDFSFPID